MAPLPVTVSVPSASSVHSTLSPGAPHSPDAAGAEILGCHAEGPFINPKKKGAQAEEAILPPDAEKLLPFAGLVRLVTLAPEMPGAPECIRALSRRMAVSIGHTDADYDTALAGLEALGALSRIPAKIDGEDTTIYRCTPPPQLLMILLLGTMNNINDKGFSSFHRAAPLLRTREKGGAE